MKRRSFLSTIGAAVGLSFIGNLSHGQHRAKVAVATKPVNPSAGVAVMYTPRKYFVLRNVGEEAIYYGADSYRINPGDSLLVFGELGVAHSITGSAMLAVESYDDGNVSDASVELSTV